MEISNVNKIVEVHKQEYVNRYLAAGWELIFAGQYQIDGCAGVTYTLGWAKTSSPVIPENIGEWKPLD